MHLCEKCTYCFSGILDRDEVGAGNPYEVCGAFGKDVSGSTVVKCDMFKAKERNPYEELYDDLMKRISSALNGFEYWSNNSQAAVEKVSDKEFWKGRVNAFDVASNTVRYALEYHKILYDSYFPKAPDDPAPNE